MPRGSDVDLCSEKTYEVRAPISEEAFSTPQVKAPICGICNKAGIYTATIGTYEEGPDIVACNSYNWGSDFLYQQYAILQQKCRDCGFGGRSWRAYISQRRVCGN